MIDAFKTEVYMSFKKSNFDLYSTPMTPTPGAKKANDLQNSTANPSEVQVINEKDFNNPLKSNSKEFLPQIASMIGRAVHGDLYKSDLLTAFDELVPDPQKEAQKQREYEKQQEPAQMNQDEFDFSFLDQSMGQAEVEIEVEFTQEHNAHDLDELAMEPIVFNQDQLAITAEQNEQEQDLFDPMKTPEMYSQTKEDLLLNESTIVETSPTEKPIFDDPFSDLNDEEDAPRFFYEDELEASLKKSKSKP
jgi:hypothetical protein